MKQKLLKASYDTKTMAGSISLYAALNALAVISKSEDIEDFKIRVSDDMTAQGLRAGEYKISETLATLTTIVETPVNVMSADTTLNIYETVGVLNSMLDDEKLIDATVTVHGNCKDSALIEGTHELLPLLKNLYGLLEQAELYYANEGDLKELGVFG